MTKQELIIKELVGWLHQQRIDYNNMFNDKERYTLSELNKMSSDFLNEYMKQRTKMRELVKSDTTLFKLMYYECKKSFLTFILWEGVSKDLQRNSDALIQPVLPYNHQLKLIELLQYSSKHIHVEKSRRQGDRKSVV